MQAEVTSILADGVQVHGRREPIAFDYLVIATGSSYAFPGKVAETDSSKAISLYNDLQQQIQRSKEILIIGGGAVGIELAGEIATDFRDKEITLVHNQPTVLQPKVFQEKFYARIQEALVRLNVKLIFNDTIQLSAGRDQPALNYIEGRRTYVTEKNKRNITADLAFICTGARVNNKSLINGPLRSALQPQTGRLIVNNYLQVDGYERIFAIGDICDKEPKFAYIATDQANYVAKLISLMDKKKPYPKEYQGHSYPLMALTIGRQGGVGQLPTKGGAVIGKCARADQMRRSRPSLGDFMMRMIKSKDLFTSRYRSALNHSSDNQAENKEAYSDQLDSMQSIMSLTEQDARDLLAGLPARQLEPGQDYI